MFGRRKWKVSGNEEKAEGLADLVLLANPLHIDVKSPFGYDHVKGQLTLVVPGYKHKGNPIVGQWTLIDELGVCSVHPGLDFKYPAKVKKRVVGYLNQLDQKDKGVPLPEFNSLGKLLKIFHGRHNGFFPNYCRESFSEVVGRDFSGLVCGRNNAIDDDTLEISWMQKPFRYEGPVVSGGGLTYKGFLSLNRGITSLTHLTVDIPNFPFERENFDNDIPWEIRKVNKEYLDDLSLFGLKDLELCGEYGSYKVKVSGRQMRVGALDDEKSIYTPGDDNSFKYLCELESVSKWLVDRSRVPEDSRDFMLVTV